MAFNIDFKELTKYSKNDFYLPVLIFILYLIFFLTIRGYIPTGEELINIFGNLYANYGYSILIISAFLESLFLINLFVPGQISMALGIIFTRTGHMQLPFVLATVVIGATLAYIIDYFLGYYGLSDVFKKYGLQKYVDKSIENTQKISNKSLALGFIHTNLASFISFGSGVLKINFFKFLSIAFVFTVIFTILWGVLIYTFSDIILEVIKRYVYFMVFLVIGYTIYSNYRKR